MKKILSLLVLSTLFIPQEGLSQKCGGGLLTFNIYTLNGEEADEFEYEIFPVSKELLKKHKDSMLTINPGYFIDHKVNESGVIFAKAYADRIIDNNDRKLNIKLQGMLDKSGISGKGKIKSTLVFTTVENIMFPVILKITHKGKSVYVLGNYFGRCERSVSLVWRNMGSVIN